MMVVTLFFLRNDMKVKHQTKWIQKRAGEIVGNACHTCVCVCLNLSFPTAFPIQISNSLSQNNFLTMTTKEVTVLLLCGLPGAGKTRLSRLLGDQQGAHVIEYDELQQDTDDLEPWREARTKAKQNLGQLPCS
jgi:hypothetical protein